MSPSDKMRKAMKKEKTEYNIYGILYDDVTKQRTHATVAAESDEEGIGMLEKSLVDGKGYEFMKGSLNAEAMDTGFKTSKKGIVFGYDELSNSLLN